MATTRAFSELKHKHYLAHGSFDDDDPPELFKHIHHGYSFRE